MRPLRSETKTLRLRWALLPYAGTVAGVYVLDQGLVAVAVYHAGIVAAWCGCRFPMRTVFRGMRWPVLAGLGALCLLTWPLLWFLWPYMALPGVEMSGLLERWGLTGGVGLIFALYSVTVHPILEETFWRGMLPDHPAGDALFAGFHVVVLAPLIQAPWLPVVFGTLWIASWIWRFLARITGGLLLPVLTHAIADLGVLLAVRALTAG